MVLILERMWMVDLDQIPHLIITYVSGVDDQRDLSCRFLGRNLGNMYDLGSEDGTTGMGVGLGPWRGALMFSVDRWLVSFRDHRCVDVRWTLA